MTQPRPILFIINDGWGYRESKKGNAVLAARTPKLYRLAKECPWSLLNASGNLTLNY
jgi:2,3-bisphosphoglycerate-independent phosphoglycerate mutase